MSDDELVGKYVLPPPPVGVQSRLHPEEERRAREAHAARIAAAVAERQRDQREVAAERARREAEHLEEALAPQRAEARRAFLLAHPDASEYAFEAFWKRTRPSLEEWRQQQVEAFRAQLAQRHGRLF